MQLKVQAVACNRCLQQRSVTRMYNLNALFELYLLICALSGRGLHKVAVAGS